jgi:hypothetical protein
MAGPLSVTSAPWAVFADSVLDAAALVARVGAARKPNPLAGLQISDQDLLDALSDVPGFEPGDPAVVSRVAEAAASTIGAARAALAAEVAANTRTGTFGAVVRTAQLSQAESELLALLVAVETQPRRQVLVAYLNDDVTARFLSVDTVRLMLGDAAEVVLAAGPGSGLRRAHFLEYGGENPWSRISLRLHPEVVWWLAGDRALPVDAPAGVEWIAGKVAGSGAVVVSSGSDRRRRLEAALSALGEPGAIVTQLPSAPREWSAVIRWATLSGSAVLLESGDRFSDVARAAVDRTVQLSWAVTSAAELPVRDLPRRRWVQAVPQDALASAEEHRTLLDGRVPLGIRLTADQLHAVAVGSRAMDGDVAAAIRRLASGGIDRLAERVIPTRTWADLVITDHQRMLLDEIVIRARHRDAVLGRATQLGRGVLAMFAGPSGTGKTLTAEVIAEALGVDLYRIDLAQVVDKYIGETEKKLAELFDAAEASPMVLLFDEADALIGRRTEVSSSHDRHANIQVAYLLQRLERHTGVTILSTNLASNIDSAFLRRIQVSVNFGRPGAAERLRIWRANLPTGMPVGEVDLDGLADLELSGGQIRNVMVRAAFLAAEVGTALDQRLIVVALTREMEKSGRMFRAEDFHLPSG